MANVERTGIIRIPAEPAGFGRFGASDSRAVAQAAEGRIVLNGFVARRNTPPRCRARLADRHVIILARRFPCRRNEVPKRGKLRQWLGELRTADRERAWAKSRCAR